MLPKSRYIFLFINLIQNVIDEKRNSLLLKQSWFELKCAILHL